MDQLSQNNQENKEGQSSPGESDVLAVIKNHHNEAKTSGKNESEKKQESIPQKPAKPSKDKVNEALDDKPEGFFEDNSPEKDEGSDLMSQAGDKQEGNTKSDISPGLTPAKEEDSQKQNKPSVEKAVENYKADNIDGATNIQKELNDNLAA